MTSRHRLQRNPLDPRGLAGVGRLADLLRVTTNEDVVPRIHRSHHGLELNQKINPASPVARSPLQLALLLCGIDRLFVIIHQTAREFPTPPVRPGTDAATASAHGLRRQREPSGPHGATARCGARTAPRPEPRHRPGPATPTDSRRLPAPRTSVIAPVRHAPDLDGSRTSSCNCACGFDGRRLKTCHSASDLDGSRTSSCDCARGFDGSRLRSRHSASDCDGSRLNSCDCARGFDGSRQALATVPAALMRAA